jgi:translation initiation factor 2 beta subunit (eIF-2beta)/eIF-5
MIFDDSEENNCAMTSSGNKINIRGKDAVDDPYYRYKMDKVKLEKHGHKLALVNLNEIARELERDPSHITSYLAKMFGTPFICKNDVILTNKKDLTENELQEAIFKYIESNVLCEKCKNPETVYVKAAKKIFLTCKACSYKTSR